MLAGERPAVHERRTAEELREILTDPAFVKAPAFSAYLTDLSLAVRECDDFLLTPALLVQEAVSDDVILTYPEE
jgi:hypothetical protein